MRTRFLSCLWMFKFRYRTRGKGAFFTTSWACRFCFLLNKNSQSITENVNTFPLLLYGLVPPAITCEISHIFRLTEVDSRWQGCSPDAYQMFPWSQMRPMGRPQTSVSEKDLCPLQCVLTSFGYSTSKKTKILNSSSKPHLTNGHLHLDHW